MRDKFISQDPANFTTGGQIGMLGRNISFDTDSDLAKTLDGVPNHQVYNEFLKVLSSFQTSDPQLVSQSQHTIRAILALRNWANDNTAYVNPVHLSLFIFDYRRALSKSASERTLYDNIYLEIAKVLGVDEATFELIRTYLDKSNKNALLQEGSQFERQERARALEPKYSEF